MPRWWQRRRVEVGVEVGAEVGADAQGETVQSPPARVPSRLSSAQIDTLRVRALQGDPLREVREPTREWVFRSLLIGKRRDEWAQLAGLAEDERAYDRALDRIRRWYQQRLAARKGS